MERHITKEVQIGNRWIGGNHPSAIQSMTNTKTEDDGNQKTDYHPAGCGYPF